MIIKVNHLHLPFIYIPEIDAKFLLDTGSTRSIINPNLAYNYYYNFIHREKFNIQASHDISFHDEVAVIPIFDSFRVDGQHKFYLFDFNKKYDGLIGMDLLEQLQAVVDIGKKLLITPFKIIPIILAENKNLPKKLRNCCHTIIIPPRTEQVVKLPVCYEKGLGLLDYINFGNKLESPRAVVNIQNYFATTTVINSDTKPCKLTINKPFDIELLDPNEVNFISAAKEEIQIDKQQDRLLKDNLKNLSL